MMTVRRKNAALINRSLLVFFLLLAAAVAPGAFATGEAINGFPNWSERVLHEWTNRARSDPQVEMIACGANCGDAACYSPTAPLLWSENLNHSSRFHADNMTKLNFQGGNSICAIAPDIGSTYPDSCDGSVGCACQGGVANCSLGCTNFAERISLFGASGFGENIAGAADQDPDAAFKLWMYLNFPTHMEGGSCQAVFSEPTNAYRWQILKNTGLVGFGMPVATAEAVIDFGSGTGSAKIPSGAHFPRQATSVDAWVNWFDAAGPSVANIDVDGVCSNMTLDRGSATNGSWHATVSGAGSGCHRYFFAFKDGNGAEVVYPTTGSLTIGDGGVSCPDWSTVSPRGCDGFDRIFVSGLDP